MNKKLKIALRNRFSEQGFAIPIAMGLGLVMLLIAATMVVRSQGDQVTASTQKGIAQSLGTAETGINRVQSLLSKYHSLASITFTNITTPPSSSWKQVYDASPSSPCTAPAAVAAGATEVSGYLLDKWTDLDSGGQFRVTEYTYRPDSAQIAGSATIPAIGSINLNISPADYLADGGSVYGQIQSVPGILSRNGTTYSFQRLSTATVISITSADTFVPKNTSAQITSVSIPASGSVTSLNISPSDYLADGGSVEGQIQGIQGTLSRNGTIYTFKRLYSGAETTFSTVDFLPTTTPGTGTLAVEGRVNQVGTSSTATKTLGTATTKLVVNIPVKFGSLNNQVPALWVKNNKITNMNKDKVNGNILINSCPPATGATSTNLKDPSTQKVIAETVPFPDTPDLPPARVDGSPSYYTLTDSPFGKTFPRPAVPAVPATRRSPAIPAIPADVPASDGYYHYLIDNLIENGSGEITIIPGKKVIFYVKGNINLSGNPDINKTTGNTADQLQIYGNTYINITETKYGCPPDTTLGSDCPTLIAHFNGTGTIRAFLHAPDATGSVNGGGSTGGNFIGSMWLKDWNASSGNDKVKIDASGNYSNYLSSQNIITPPLISPISSWQQQEASP